MRVIIVHSLQDAQTALEAASALGCKVTLQSAPDAIFYAGGLYLLELCKLAPDNFILDCGDAGAEAIAAMQSGHRLLRSSAPAVLRDKLKSVAAQLGATLAEGPYESLDLHGVRDTKAACYEWLKGTI